MSMPSSSEEVATRQGSSPDFSSSSTTSRSSRASEPWWARAISAGSSILAGQLVQPHRQPLGAAAVVHEDDRRAVLLHELEQLGVDRRPDRARGSPSGVAEPAPRGRRRRRGALPPPRVGTSWASGSRMSSTGTWIFRSSGLRTPVSTTVHSRPGADQEAAHLLQRALGGRQADPLDRLARPACSRRSSVSARWAPRLVRATAWISSTITHSAPARISRAREVSIR